MYQKVTITQDWNTSLGLLLEGKYYALPQGVYKDEVSGKVGHTNFGPCEASDAEVLYAPALPAILDQQAPEATPDATTQELPTQPEFHSDLE